MAQDPMEVFIQNLILAAGLDGMPDEYKADYIDKLRVQIDRRIGVIAMQELDSAGLDEFRQMMEREPKISNAALQQFFAGKIDNFPEKVQQGLQDFAAEFIAAAKKE
ncbi:MAG: DUF5663 domain-containing protein [Patescibacteria group bacterium]|jgi:hypothetical protein